MEEIVFSLNLVILFALVAGIFALNYFLLRKIIFFWFDPLLLYIIFNSFSIAFVIYLYFWEKEIKEFYIVTFFISSLGFLIGLITGSRFALKKISVNKAFNDEVLTNYDQVFDIFIIISVAILISSNLVMLITVGTLPILSADPSTAKVELYTGGWGIVRRIDFVLVNFIFSIGLLKLFHPVNKVTDQKKIFCWISILIAILILFTMGSKSSLIGILNSLFGVAMINVYFGKTLTGIEKIAQNLKIIKIFGKYALIFGFAYMFLVIIKTGVESSAGDTFITRLVGAGDTFYFFYVYDLYDSFKLNFFDFILHLINPIMGFLRLAPYEFPLGAYMLNYAFGLPLSSFGPNAQHHIEGLLYFGKAGTLFYSFTIGIIIARMRLSLLNKVLKKPDFLRLIIYISVVSIAVTAATEIDFFLLLFYDIMMFGAGIFIISLLIDNTLKKIKKMRKISVYD